MDEIKGIVEGVFKGLKDPEVKQRVSLSSHWEKIAGKKLAAHSSPKLTRNGILAVWVDQPVMAFEVKQKYQKVLLSRVRALLGEDKVKEIRIYVGQIR